MLDIYIITIIAIIYFIDVNYFLRIIFTFVWTKCMQKQAKLTDETTIYGKDLTIKISLLIQ